jgi:hypothetical protein
MKLVNIPFRIESKLVRWYCRTTGARPASYPYLSGDGFRRLARWRYEDPSAPGFTPLDVGAGDLIFCDAWQLDRFLSEFATGISVPFRVISHNGDPNFTEERLSRWPRNLTRLYTQNNLCSDPRVVSLPIGLENACLHYNGVVRDFERLRCGPPPGQNRILVAFTVGTNAAVRGAARSQLDRNPLVVSVDRLNSRAYRKLATGYRFIASPPGNGEDCHRTWEALYLRSVPIVLRSPFTQAMVSLGLPLWIVDSYESLTGLSEADLDREYRARQGGFASPALWMDFWESRIRSDE